MHKIEFKDILPAKQNPRANKLAAVINSPVSEIDVDQPNKGFEKINGHTRLNVQLDVHGSAVVRDVGTGEQFTV